MVHKLGIWGNKAGQIEPLLDNDLQNKCIKIQANLSDALKSLKLQGFQRMGMCLPRHQPGGTLASCQVNFWVI